MSHVRTITAILATVERIPRFRSTPLWGVLLGIGALASAACSSSSKTNGAGGGDGGASATDSSMTTPASDSGSSGDTSQNAFEDSAASAGDSGTSVDASDGDSQGTMDTGTTSPTDGSVAVPAPAASAGFTEIVFEDDFTTTDTIAPTASAPSGYKWYWSYDVTSPVPWAVSTTATAASISNGNTGGGANASPAGGILTITGPGAPNDALITVPGGALNDSHATLPAEGDGCWSHAYFEAYLQFKIDGDPVNQESNGWPAFWSWSAQGLKGYGYGSSAISTANYTEIDFMETYDQLFSDQPGDWTATMHQWPANTTSDGDTEHVDSNWHTYGCLWTSTGTGTGQVLFYLDGAQVDHTVDTGTNQTQFSLEGMYQFLILGSGKDWPLNVDWVRVWQ